MVDVIKRVGFGLLVGLLIGAGIALGLHFGLGVTVASGLLMYLLAMGSGATAGILAGKPPWRQEAWIEAILKALAGMGFGALVVWLSSSYVPWTISGTPLELTAGTPFANVLLLVLPVVAGLFGALVGLDDTSEKESSGAKRARVAGLPEVNAIPEPVEAKARKSRRTARD